MTAPAPLLLLAVGNPSRGDDALGPALLAALQAQGAGDDGALELLGDFQLQVEHALDLQGRHAVLFVDAARPGTVGAAGKPGGIALQPLAPAVALPALSHALSAAAVLRVAQQLGGPVPPAWQLAIEGEQFGLGEPMSTPAQARLAAAMVLAQQWIRTQRAALAAQVPGHA